MIGAWVNSIAKNMLKNRLRADQRLEGLTETSKTASPALLSVDAKRILGRCDGRDSKILRGYYIEGYTTEELARQVGLTPVTVRVRLLRIRRALRSQLIRPAPVAEAA
jgi:RNA polymerase sigma-70 factor (ECF subfamily)